MRIKDLKSADRPLYEPKRYGVDLEYDYSHHPDILFRWHSDIGRQWWSSQMHLAGHSFELLPVEKRRLQKRLRAEIERKLTTRL